MHPRTLAITPDHVVDKRNSFATALIGTSFTGGNSKVRSVDVVALTGRLFGPVQSPLVLGRAHPCLSSVIVVGERTPRAAHRSAFKACVAMQITVAWVCKFICLPAASSFVVGQQPSRSSPSSG